MNFWPKDTASDPLPSRVACENILSLSSGSNCRESFKAFRNFLASRHLVPLASQTLNAISTRSRTEFAFAIASTVNIYSSMSIVPLLARSWILNSCWTEGSLASNLSILANSLKFTVSSILTSLFCTNSSSTLTFCRPSLQRSLWASTITAAWGKCSVCALFIIRQSSYV